MKKTSLGERLENGGVICAEGFLFEVERRGLYGFRRFCTGSGVGKSRRFERFASGFSTRRQRCGAGLYLQRPPRKKCAFSAKKIY